MGVMGSRRDRGRREKRCSFWPVVSALALIASSMTLAPAQAARTPLVLGASNTFTASRTAGAWVRLPESTWLDLDKGVKVVGRGRIAGFILVQREARNNNERFVLAGWDISYCQTPGCGSRKRRMWFTGFKVERGPKGGTVDVPAGDYLLYVIADRTPVRVTINPHGLKGENRVRLTEPANSAIRTPEPSISGVPGQKIYSWGSTAELRGTVGYLLTLFRIRGRDWQGGRWDACFYKDPPPRPLAYGPRCPTGGGVGWYDGGQRNGKFEIEDGGIGLVGPPGTFGYGGNYEAAAEIDRVDTLDFFLDINPNEL